MLVNVKVTGGLTQQTVFMYFNLFAQLFNQLTFSTVQGLVAHLLPLKKKKC